MTSGSRPLRRTGAILVLASMLALDASAQSRPDSARAERTHRRTPRRHAFAAAMEGLVINVALQRFNHYVRRAPWADIGVDDWKRNVREGWTWDVDQFQTNMFGHPYGGSFYFNAGRENGLSFWGSIPLVFAGSATWEYFAENERPSLNDLYTTVMGGVVYGEIGHRLGGLIRDNRARGLERALLEIAALPFDPVGGVHRVFRGEAGRVLTDPDARDRSAFSVEIQAGSRLAVDSGSARKRSYSPTFLGDIAYGDAFAGPYRQPFDVFRARFQFSIGTGGLNIARLRGRLWGRELTDSSSRHRHILTLQQKSEYVNGPAYKFGGQSLEIGLVSDLQLTPHAHIQGELFGEWLLLGGIDAPGAGVRQRAYDFGPGFGFTTAATVVVSGYSLLTARYRFGYIHSISGSPADHRTSLISAEGAVPITRHIGLGGYAGWYYQRSIYGPALRPTLSYPEFRAYATWRTGRGPVSREAAGGL